ncbi:hypothetical protein NQ095_08895 [Rossellomorea sp. SC111]|uniref:hypothetical protein n=1 Tax=Rossellomorea sp. SC111 TaxID=2968985 RepID=UPI00215A3874|nr:hypothetical protein [Rossellomorea sp. SC111]MCR8848517.1 hypothetical protein [Rossellomorea sp. SC111]
MKKLTINLFILTSLITLMAGCSAPKESDNNVDTIQTFLENEFTGPNDELTSAFKQDDAFPPELEEYVEETYKPLVKNWEDMVNTNHILLYQRMAYENGYQLKPTDINITKDQDLAYEYEVNVEYSKDGETNTATISGRMNLNDDGEIVSIRNVKDGGLLKKLNQ